MKHFLLTTALMIAPLAASAEQVIRMTAASSHPVQIPWVGLMKSEIVDQINPRLEAEGIDLRIEWTEAYAGVLYGFDDTLEAVAEGIADIGWVGALFEPAKMPIQNAAYAVPFSTPDPTVSLEILDNLNSRDTIFRQEWIDNNLMYLGTMATDGYQIYSKTPVRTPEDLKGMKVQGSASVGAWVEGFGATFINAGIPVMYNQMETGVADATLLITSGAKVSKLHEVGPYVTLLDMGPGTGGGVGMNLDTWNKLPPEAQAIFVELGKNYTKALGDTVKALREAALTEIEADGGTLIPVSPEEKVMWANALPDIAGEWLAAQSGRGVPAKEAIDLFMNELAAFEITPIRVWNTE